MTVDPDVYLDVEDPAAPNNQGDRFVRENAAATDFGGAQRLDGGYHASYGKARSFILNKLPPTHSGLGKVVDGRVPGPV